MRKSIVTLMTGFIKWTLLFLAIFFLATSDGFSQTGTIRGFVYDKETGEPIIFTNVYLFKTPYGASTDVNGYFTISRVPDGNYSLLVTYLGFDTLREQVLIKGNTVITKKLFLSKASYALEGISISAEYQELRTDTRTSVVKITPKQIKQIPSIGGQADLAQYLQVLPGVIFTGDQGGQLYIRGGSPIQNKVMLDGMVIYNPFHSIGLFSVFETDILRTADIYTGGFGAAYGGRISSMMDLTTRDGNKKRIAGKAGASTFGAKLLLEGPISKAKTENSGSSSFVLSFKNSYLEQSSKQLYSYIDANGLPFNFTDLYGKISLNSSNGSKVNFFGFNYNDQVKYKAISDFNWNATGVGTNFVVIPGNNPVLLEGSLAYSSYLINLSENNAPDRSSLINGFNAGMGFTYFLGKDQLKYGLELLGFTTSFDYTNSLNRKIQQKENTSEIAGYITYKISRKNFLIEPGFRAQYYASLSNFSPEPRLAVKYLVNSKLRLKMAGGFYSQNLVAANSDRDVVNLFYGFLSGSENVPKTFNGKELTHKLQKAQHIILGAEFDPAKFITMNFEVYYKYFSQLTNINRNKIFEDVDPYSDPSSISYKPESLRKDFVIENGDAYGFDVSFKFDRKNLYIWAVYSLAYVNRFDGTTHYAPHYDRRHNVNLVTSYRFGNENSWEVNFRWNFGSGFPFTQTQGFYEELNFEEGIFSNIITQNGSLGIIYGEYNKGRLPYYHRLDGGITKTFQLRENSSLEVNFTITNAYNRKNIFYVDRISNEKVYQLPLMPSAGLNLTF
ncbi:MAG: TonB-dependent receptor [Bacteroidales bacterium]|nr:TonB-dependent receptor [Bacteroidales bacterium]